MAPPPDPVVLEAQFTARLQTLVAGIEQWLEDFKNRKKVIARVGYEEFSNKFRWPESYSFSYYKKILSKDLGLPDDEGPVVNFRDSINAVASRKDEGWSTKLVKMTSAEKWFAGVRGKLDQVEAQARVRAAALKASTLSKYTGLTEAEQDTL